MRNLELEIRRRLSRRILRVHRWGEKDTDSRRREQLGPPQPVFLRLDTFYEKATPIRSVRIRSWQNDHCDLLQHSDGLSFGVVLPIRVGYRHLNRRWIWPDSSTRT